MNFADQTFLNVIMDTEGVLILVLDRTGRVVRFNRACEWLSGKTFAEVEGQPIWQVFPPEQKVDQFLEAFARICADAVPMTYESLSKAWDGVVHYIEWHATTLLDEQGCVQFVIGVGVDTTEEHQAQRQARQLAAIVASSNDAIISKTLEGRIVSWNAGAEQLYGYMAEEMIGRSISLLLPADRANEIADLLAQLRQGERIEHYETVRCHKSGREIPVSLTISPIHNEAGRIVGASSIARDISAQKEAEAALRHSEALAQSILSSVTAHIAVLDGAGQVVAVNDAWRGFVREHEHHYPGREGITAEELQVCRCAAGVCDCNEEGAPEGIRAVLAGTRSSFTTEYACHADDGDHWFLMHVSPLVGGRKGAIVTHVDITEQKEAQLAVQESQARLDAIINSATDVIITIDEQQRIVQFNAAAQHTFQYELADVFGQPLEILLPERFREIHQQHVAHFAQTGITRRTIAPLTGLFGRRANGEEFPIEATISRVDVAGQYLLTVILRDVTRRLLAEQEKDRLLQQVSRQREQLRAQAQHLRKLTQRVVLAQEQERHRVSRELHDEAGQALTALKFNLELMRAAIPEQAQVMVDGLQMRQQLAATAALCEETMVQIRALAHDLRPGALDDLGLNLTLEGYCHDFAERTHLHISYQGAEIPSLPEMAELCLYRFLQEALTNVARHAKTDRAWVHLSDNNGWVRLSVADVGLGFAFQQNGPLHSSAAGIGLLGMQERLEAVGGKLRILSAPGRGTEVEAAVPIVRNDLGEEESPPLQTVVLMEG
jgi:hypothetical protein